MVIWPFFLPFIHLTSWSPGLLALPLPFVALLTWPGSGSCLLWTLPDVSASGDALSHTYNKLSPPWYLGAFLSSLFLFLFSFILLACIWEFWRSKMTLISLFSKILLLVDVKFTDESSCPTLSSTFLIVYILTPLTFLIFPQKIACNSFTLIYYIHLYILKYWKLNQIHETWSNISKSLSSAFKWDMFIE